MPDTTLPTAPADPVVPPVPEAPVPVPVVPVIVVPAPILTGDAREAALALREAALDQKERHLSAVQMLHDRNLPAKLIDLIDLHSSETLTRSLELAAAARNIPSVPAASPTDLAAPGKKATYQEYLDHHQSK